MPARNAAAAAGAAAAPPPFVLVASGLVGFAFFLLELVWYRMLGPILGGTVYTFGLVLAVALLGIAAGGLAYARLPGLAGLGLRAFTATCVLEAALVALPYALGDRVALLALDLRPAQGALPAVIGRRVQPAGAVLALRHRPRRKGVCQLVVLWAVAVLKY